MFFMITSIVELQLSNRCKPKKIYSSAENKLNFKSMPNSTTFKVHLSKTICSIYLLYVYYIHMYFKKDVIVHIPLVGCFYWLIFVFCVILWKRRIKFWILGISVCLDIVCILYVDVSENFVDALCFRVGMHISGLIRLISKCVNFCWSW